MFFAPLTKAGGTKDKVNNLKTPNSRLASEYWLPDVLTSGY